MSIIRLKIKTLQPVLATSFDGDPNSDVSYPYLPGSMLRGALIGRYLRQSRQRELDLADPLVQTLFFNAQQSAYLNAYPVSQAGNRTLPTPRSWFKEKGKDIPLTAYDFSLKVNEDTALCAEVKPKFLLRAARSAALNKNFVPHASARCCIQSPKPVGSGFWGYDSKQQINFYQPSKRINIHNARDRSKGRGTETEGAIFRYEAIEIGETFESMIICPSEYVSEIEKLLKPEDFWLGGSQSAGYGHVRITYEVLTEPWREVGTQPKVEHDGLQITLLSDVILRDAMGQVTADPDLLRQAIAEKLNVELTFHPEHRSYVGQTTIGGFNRKWGLPLPQMSALAMGSVLMLQGALTPEQIQQLEREGIGDRRIDGFGRLAVNAWQKEQFEISKPYEPAQTPSVPPLTGEDLSRVQTLAQRILHQRLESELQKKTGELSIQGKISNSQLSRLRLIARKSISQNDATDSTSFTALASLLENLPRNAKDQFNRAKVDGRSLMNWVTENLKQPGEWITNPDQLTVTIANQSYPIDDSMKREYTLRLIMALARKATKMEESV